MEDVDGACFARPKLGGSRGMPPREIFGKLMLRDAFWVILSLKFYVCTWFSERGERSLF